MNTHILLSASKTCQMPVYRQKRNIPDNAGCLITKKLLFCAHHSKYINIILFLKAPSIHLWSNVCRLEK